MSNLNSASKRKLSNLEFLLGDYEHQLKSAIASKARYLKYMNYKDGINSLIGITGLASGVINHWDRFDAEQLKEYILAIARGSDRIVNLVNNMLDLAYINYKDFSLHRASLNLKPWLKQKFQKYSLCENITRNIKLVSQLDDGMLFSCDKYLINRLFDNLMLSLFDISEIKEVKVDIINQTTSRLENAQYVQVIINFRQLSSSASFDRFWHDKFAHISDDSKAFEFEFSEDAGLILACKIIELHQGRIRIENSAEQTKNIIFTLRIY